MPALVPLLAALGLAASPAPAASPAATSPPGGRCEDLARLNLPTTTVTSARSVAAGPFPLPPPPPPFPPAAPVDLPAFCRVAGSIKPSADSDIQFEVWLPASGWNGRLKGIGNGGFAGSIDLAALARAVAGGYAATATDTGHKGTPVDASWALGHPEKVVDFGWRAIHLTAVTAKALAAVFYSRPVERAYFHSCSNGGRQALMEAQRYPADYDGIIAGAPANDWTHLLTQAVWNRQATELDAESYIPASKLPAIEAATLGQCDAKDGVDDGVVDDPVACAFRPRELLCQGEESDACLTGPQLAALRKLYAGPRTADGRLVHPGLVAGGATGPGSWGLWVTGTGPGTSLIGTFGTQFFRNMVFEDPAWDFRSFQLDRDVKTATDKLAATLNATDPDLGAFRARGGKLILWHGWSDPAISPLNSIAYEASVRAAMGGAAADTFVRLFMLPGVQHCDGGPGATGFSGASALQHDADHDLNLAIERWVEKGTAPEHLVAARYKDGSDPASGLVRTRRLCPYPEVARYKGEGSTDDETSFACVRTPR